MKVMVIVKATRSSEEDPVPDTAMLEAMGRYNEELADAGILLSADGLHPTAKGVRVHFSGDQRTVSKGPFDATHEIAGYWIWEVKSMDEAIAWVKRCPNPMPEDSDIDIRPIFEAEEFAKFLTPELAEQEVRLQRKIAGKK